MKTVIFYYTGTGNSLWSARLLAEKLGRREAAAHEGRGRPGSRRRRCGGFRLPGAHVGHPRPGRAISSRNWPLRPRRTYFALAVNAGQVSRTLLQLSGLLARRGLNARRRLRSLSCPATTFPGAAPAPTERRNESLRCAPATKSDAAAACIAGREAGPIEKGPLWQRIVFTAIYKMTFKQVPKMDKDFWCDDRCNACGICVRVCPAKNIDSGSRQAGLAASLRAVPGLHPVVPAGVDPVRQKNAGLRALPPSRSSR